MSRPHRRALALVVAAGAALALPSSAPARVIEAEGILPPGQSGYVSLTGLTGGTGSPHLYDQQPLFIDFKRKPFGMNLATGTPETPKAGVSIRRDTFGVPAVTGATELDAWWGAGYALAQDRMFQLEAFRHATQGRLAEVTGKGALGDDLISRRDYYTPAELNAQFERFPLPLRQRTQAYVDGINAWISHLQATPTDLPAEYIATGTALTPWTVVDTLGIGVFLARTVPSGDGSELRNLRAVQDSGAGVLDALLPRSIKGQLSTIPRSEGLFPQGRVLSAKKAAAARKRSLAFAKTLPATSDGTARAAARKADRPAGMIGRTGGSSMFAVRAPGKRAILFNGPQLGFSVPELFVEIELHAPGYDVRGVTAAGIPVVGIGHNDTVAWGFTSGLSDEDDLYAEKLDPQDRESYLYKGQWRKMDCRNERFDFKSPPSDLLLGGKIPESGSVTRRVCRTVHGPVQAVEGNVAYARKYAIWQRDLESLVGIDLLNRAKTIKDVDAAARAVTWNENIMAADSQGNIGYWHPGLVQIRPSRWDERLPLPGTGEAEWGGLVPRSKMPHVINPKQGWLANWNNIPSQGWTSGDGESSERVTGQFHRVGWLMRLVRDLRKAPSFQAARSVVEREGRVAQQRPLASARLRRAQKGATGKAKSILDTVLTWDGDYHRQAADGTVDPGVAAWEAYKTALAARAVARLGKGASRFEDRPGGSHAFDITAKESYALRTLTPAGYRAAAVTAFDALAKRFGSEDPARWREPRLLYDVGAQGAGQAPPLPFFDRGTWEQIVELGP
ncbi:Penicillin G acylase [Paraconexibacter sp. AEG42_29]|uniref:Penicillin G acylase n=1 Tax=Paraconexibacter sp. AEG42_29 TaxID=2997339 RepID=A0AAU7ARC9_9ACTN